MKPKTEKLLEELFNEIRSYLLEDCYAARFPRLLEKIVGPWYAPRYQPILREMEILFPDLLEELKLDAKAAFERDPAAESLEEVILTYPGLYGLMGHRLAHLFYRLEVKILPRLISSYVLKNVSIDIHPGAQIGAGCFIDHGIGLVIGETAILGKNVTLYHGVTLGAKSIPKGKTKAKRHPTLEEGVTVFANATILGGETIIPKNSVIPANAFITNNRVGISPPKSEDGAQNTWHVDCSTEKLKETKMKDQNTATIRSRTNIPLAKGIGEFISFNGLCDRKEHIAILFGELSKMNAPLVRLHSECLTGDIFGSAKCDCGPQLQEALRKTQEENGIILYLRQEGRGIGLYNKLETYVLQNEGLDTYAANNALGFQNDCRDYTVAAQMLRAMGITNIRLLSNNPDKAAQLESQGIRIQERIATGAYVNATNLNYLVTKAEKTKHTINF